MSDEVESSDYRNVKWAVLARRKPNSVNWGVVYEGLNPPIPGDVVRVPDDERERLEVLLTVLGSKVDENTGTMYTVYSCGATRYMIREPFLFPWERPVSFERDQKDRVESGRWEWVPSDVAGRVAAALASR